MKATMCPQAKPGGKRLFIAWLGTGFLVLLLALPSRAVSPYSRTRQYDLQNVKVELSFDLAHREVMGEVTESLNVIREGITSLRFDSSELTIDGITLNGKPAQSNTEKDELDVTLPAPAKKGEAYTVEIRYHGFPKRGLYFILPDKNYPNQPEEVWSQGEDEDTHYYIPIYDYPNDKTATEMVLTVPPKWVTISNGKLISVKPGPNGMKVWDWRQAEPISTYLISVVAGQFDQKNADWRGMPLNYLVPKGEADTVEPTFVRTPAMLSAFSDSLAVRYPWAKYAQSAVDDFVVGGMENASATTLTTRGLVDPALAGETPQDSDGLISHEMAHQWFGDLVTCKDWADLWLNEGFATFFEHYWTETHYGKDAVDYEFWRDGRNWFRQERLFDAPIVNYNETNSLAYSGNIYTKGGLVLKMLREKLGDENFFHSLNAYLNANRYKNVATADLVKSIEQATGISVDRFFHQWVYGAGAPRFEVTDQYDASAHMLKLTVKQTQKVEGRVGLFHVPIEVEITTASGHKSYPIQVADAEETYSLPANGQPLMVLFDKGNKILKSVDFKKSPEELIYQLKHAETVPDRADAAAALGEVKDNAAVVSALGEAALHDSFWGVRNEAIQSLGRIHTPDAGQQIAAALANSEPWVRSEAVDQLGHFESSADFAKRLTDIAANDRAWRVRAAALEALGEMKAPGAFDVLEKAASANSPDEILQAAAMRGLGSLGDDKAVPILSAWAAPGKSMHVRPAAIESLGRLDKQNHEITKQLVSYLADGQIDVQRAAIFALAMRGDKDAVPALEAYANSDSVTIGMRPFLQRIVQQMKEGKPVNLFGGGGGPPAAAAKPAEVSNADLMKAVKALQKQVASMSEQLSKMQAGGASKN